MTPTTQQTAGARRFQAYCVGTSKSGTHSLAAVFGRHYRAAHEPEYEQVINTAIAASRGVLGERRLADFVRERDARLGLELECSHPLFHLLDALLAEFPEARFVLTIRDCYSWLDSQMNSHLAYIEERCWRDFGEFKYRADALRHPQEEQLLERFGLFTLDGYLSAWAEHNQKVLTSVPPEKLLVIRTQDIGREVARLADFVGASVSRLDTAGAHSFKVDKKFGLLSKLDAQYVDEKVNKYCRALMDTYFPELEDYRAWESARRPAA